MVVDPPFGGLAEVLGRSIGKLWVMAGYDVPTMLVFPYFNEQHLCSALPSLTMSDYQVSVNRLLEILRIPLHSYSRSQTVFSCSRSQTYNANSFSDRPHR